MRTILKLIIGISIIVSTSSCVSNKMLTSSVPPSAINEMVYFEPISYIHLIKKGNKSKLNDSLSQITKNKVENILLKNKGKLNISNSIKVENDTLTKRIENEIIFLIQTASRNKSLKGLTLTPTIDSILKSNNQRFALAIVSVGFGRRKGNYSGQVAKAIGIGVLTLGMYIPAPVKSNITIYGIIFDSKLNEIAFYKRTKPIEKSPTDSKILEKQITKLFEGYFYKRKR